MNPFVFIVGCPRSGTTLLQRVLNAHPQLAITPESHWIPRLAAKHWAVTDDGLVTSKLVCRLLAHRKFARLQIAQEQVLAIVGRDRRVSYSSLVSQIFGLYGEMQRKPLVGDKTFTQGLRDWRSQMPPEQVESFEAIAGKLLEDLGYPRAVPRPSSEAMRHSSKIRESFARDPRTNSGMTTFKVLT
jgi:hypothetical protein